MRKGVHKLNRRGIQTFIAVLIALAMTVSVAITVLLIVNSSMRSATPTYSMVVVKRAEVVKEGNWEHVKLLVYNPTNVRATVYVRNVIFLTNEFSTTIYGGIRDNGATSIEPGDTKEVIAIVNTLVSFNPSTTACLIQYRVRLDDGTSYDAYTLVVPVSSS